MSGPPSGDVGLDPEDWEDEATVTMDAFSSGAFFGDRFQLGSALGTGAMGRVIAARDLTTGQEVALKVLHKDRAKQAEALERFRREAAILDAIGHPGIVRVIAMGNAPDGTPWLAMELLRGETLKARIARGPMHAQEVVPILDAIGDALAAAHASGVVHRDLKPENVLLLSSGPIAAKILDFGLSRFTASKTMTRTGTIIGTPRYMPPEQIKSASTAEPPVDVFAAGAILFEMLTGRSPYPAEDMGQLLGCVLSGRRVPLAQLRPDLPPGVGQVIDQAMALDPAARFPTARALADAFAVAVGARATFTPAGFAPPPAVHSPAVPLPAAATAAAPGAKPLVDPALPVMPPRDSSPGRASWTGSHAAFTRPSHPALQERASSTPSPAARAKRPSLVLGCALFAIAILVVAAGAAIGGFALRAIMQGRVPFTNGALS